LAQKAVLIVNTRSRRGRAWFAVAKHTLQELGVELTESLALRRPAQVPAAARAAIEGGVPLVIVGGGDGTLSAVARYFVGSEATLGVLPLGTGNEFARDLGIAANVETACRVITEGKAVNVDVGLVGDDCFLNVATVGLTTLVAQELTVAAKRQWGRFVYFIALSHALRRVRPFRATLTTPEGTQTFDTLQVVIGNGRFHAGPFPLAPDATITDGKLIAYALTGTNRWELLRYALNLPGGRHVKLPDVLAVHTTEGMLETKPSQRVVVDGEIEFRTPIRFGIAPKALRVMVPQDFAG
jgi:YegS/Rv2252/BmrU family lipid kinase